MESSVILFRSAIMKTFFNRLLSEALSAAMVISAVPIVSTHAEESIESFTYSNDEYTVTYNVKAI